ncbi:MAG: lipoyl(octanoyl) transferase LipB [Dysgonamonadaceae bacterium]|jgi:lipoyl(octanoyl) transferase|nr:lipoyl(octanoyl) transferase LipB [Dysgonamonadaceae bacterium]
MHKLEKYDWGTVPYALAFEQQKKLFEQSIQAKSRGEKTDNILVVCEHPHVVTIGKNGAISNLLFSEDYLKQQGVQLFHVDRGGDITYHGPGQLVGYPILDLETYRLGLKAYIARLETIIIRLLALYGISGKIVEDAPGVWIDSDDPQKIRKICAIGIRSSRYVTMHGYALNINTNLDYFRLINPCGFKDRGVTSMQNELGRPVEINTVKRQLFCLFDEVFQ